MRCPTARTVLTRRLREPIPPADERRLARHLSRCPRCRVEQTATATLAARLEREWCATDRACTDVVDARAIVDLLRHEERVIGLGARFRLGLALTLAGATVVAVTVVAMQGPVGSRDAVAVPRRMNSRATRAQSPPARTVGAAPCGRPGQAQGPAPTVGEGRVKVPFVARGFNRRDQGGITRDERTPTDEIIYPFAPPNPTPAPTVPLRDDFITIPPPRIAAAGPEGDRAAAEAAAAYRREQAVVDARLARKVTLGVKATALSDLCDQIRRETGIHFIAGPSVADEKMTLFCRELPLRDVMRQVSRPFGYTWLRSGKPDAYRYELVQDLRSQLMEEELRQRDRHAALVALDEELGRFRQYLDLSPDEALARARSATGEEKKRLERYASWGWGPTPVYHRLTPADIAALRAGERITFSGAPQEGERELPADLARGVLQSARDFRVEKTESGYRVGTADKRPNGVLPAQVPEARGKIIIEIDQDDLGKMVFGVASGITGIFPGGGHWIHGESLAVGESPSVRSPENAAANKALARDPTFSPRVTVAPRPAYRPPPDARPPDNGQTPPRSYGGPLPTQPMVTTAEVLEAIHQATGLPLVADYYTRLYPASSLSVQDVRLFDALNRLCDTMRLKWHKEGDWIQLRSTSYFHDRLKEVPNRLLRQWVASRKQHGALTLDDLCEIVSLPQAQLDAAEMAEGARVLHGLMEWGLPRRGSVRRYLQHLAQFTPAQRRQMQAPPGLPFSQMTLAQQQGFLALAFGRGGDGDARLEHLAGATMRVDYAVPGAFEWRLPREPGSAFSPEVLLPRVRERTVEAAMQAARRIDPQVIESQIRPTEPALTILYLPGADSPLSPGGVRAAGTGTENRMMTLRAP